MICSAWRTSNRVLRRPGDFALSTLKSASNAIDLMRIVSDIGKRHRLTCGRLGFTRLPRG